MNLWKIKMCTYCAQSFEHMWGLHCLLSIATSIWAEEKSVFSSWIPLLLMVILMQLYRPILNWVFERAHRHQWICVSLLALVFAGHVVLVLIITTSLCVEDLSWMTMVHAPQKCNGRGHWQKLDKGVWWGIVIVRTWEGVHIYTTIDSKLTVALWLIKLPNSTVIRFSVEWFALSSLFTKQEIVWRIVEWQAVYVVPYCCTNSRVYNTVGQRSLFHWVVFKILV